MPINAGMKATADQIYGREMERIALETRSEMEKVIRDITRRGLVNSGIDYGNRLKAQTRALHERCKARAQSYLTVFKEAAHGLTDDDISQIVGEVSEIADRTAESIAANLTEQLRRANSPIGAQWVSNNLDRAKSSAVATIRRNLLIEMGLQKLRAATVRTKDTSLSAFIIMSFNPELNVLYEEAILPAVNGCGLTPFRVDSEEFDGTINEVILDKIRTCRIILADLTEERPNCYFEVGYSMALGKPCVMSAREDHDPRRDFRAPDDPKVHFDLDCHKISFWRADALSQLREELADRIRKVLTL